MLEGTPAVAERPARGDERSVQRAANAGSLQQLLAAVGSSPAGLSDEEASARLAALGSNQLPQARPAHVRRLREQLTHLMALLLWAAGGIAFAAGMSELGVAIWLVNLLNAAFTYVQEYRAERATEALLHLVPRRAVVVRTGDERYVDASTLVPGDVVVLTEGDRVPADARLLEASDLSVDESALTGESEPVWKEAREGPPMSEGEAARSRLYSGSTVSTGAARAIVYATGAATTFGRVATLTEKVREPRSPLERELRRVTRLVSCLAVGVGLAFFALATVSAGVAPATAMIFALGMIVAFVPEGLLPTVTLALSIGTQRMAKRNAIVKRLSSVEALGACTVICTDKTGTLTRNEMTLLGVHVLAGRASATGSGWAPEGYISVDETGPGRDALLTDVRGLLEVAALASDAELEPPADGRGWRVIGDPTEGALIVALRKAGIDEKALRARAPRVQEHPFDSQRMRMSTVHVVDGERVLCVKGAPEELLALCSHSRRDRVSAPLDDETRARILSDSDAAAARGERVLGVATRALGDDEVGATADVLERGLTFLGFVTMRDPPRPDVPEAIKRCRGAGIHVIMLTGDHPRAATSICRQIGILDEGEGQTITGPALATLDDDELYEALRGPVVFARVLPEHKLRIVEALQRHGHTVAVTGDGVNDAPALRRADIGVAMGRSGTEVARAASDMILLDDHFATIVNAIDEGRAVFDNIRRFTSYIFTSNVAEAVPFMVFALSGGAVPLALGVMHILIVDLGTDIVPALALGAEPPDEGAMRRPPRRRDEHFVTIGLLARAALFLGPLAALAVMAAFFAHYWMSGYPLRFADLPAEGAVYRAATGVALGAVVASQIGNLFAHRSANEPITKVGLRGNRLLYVGVASELAILLAVLYVPPLARVIGVAPFSPMEWVLLLAITPLLLVADEARKWLVRRRRAARARALPHRPAEHAWRHSPT